MQRTPPPNEKQIQAAAFTETKLLAENARNVISVGHINEQIVVRKRFRAATANPDRCPASRRFDARAFPRDGAIKTASTPGTALDVAVRDDAAAPRSSQSLSAAQGGQR